MGLKPGMNAEIAIAWPFLLDGRLRLQLVLEGTITRSLAFKAVGSLNLPDFPSEVTRNTGEHAVYMLGAYSTENAPFGKQSFTMLSG